MGEGVAFAPIFIIGVPRSGTTLLRVLLDSHSEIAALPETPWLLGAYGPEPSLRGVLEGLIEGPYGVVRNIAGVQPGHVFAAGGSFLETLFEPLLKARHKRLLAFKTPADIRHLDLLLKLVPDAFYIHITRDGRDVALSQLAKKGRFFDDLREYRRLGFANLMRRWAEWEQRIRTLLYQGSVRVVHVKYEDLIDDPARELRRITEFLGVPFEAGMVDYASSHHDYPRWEAGSTDVAKHEGVSGASAGRWRQARMTGEMLHALMKYDGILVELGYPSSGLSPGRAHLALARLFPLVSPFLNFTSRMRLFLRPLFKSRARLAACAAIAALTAEFLIPGSWLPAPGLAADRYQPALCFAAGLAFAWGFGPALLRRSKGAHPLSQYLFKGLGSMGAAIFILELAQSFAADRHGSLTDFLLNATGVAVAMLIAIPFLRKADAGLEPHDQGARARTSALTA
jgi:hypothetical protein